jgi:uncharacterized membrane protein
MNAMIRTMLGLGLVTLIAGPAAAQGQGRGFGRFGNPAMLLANASVQQELKLDDKQVEKAKELAEKAREKGQEARSALEGLEGEELQKKRQEIQRETTAWATKEMGEFLKADQVARLKQISYQQRGAQAFTDPEVAAKLNLSDSQKTDLQEIQRESMQEMRSIFQDNQGDREAAMKKMAELRKQTLSKAEAKLNDEQKKSWKDLLGAPFEIKYEQN